MEKFNLSTSRLNALIKHLMTRGIVYAPHKNGEVSFSFDEVRDPGKVILNYNRTLQSIKKYFLPPREQLLSFSLKSGSLSKVEPENPLRIFLGVHSYDMQAVLRLDYNFSQGNPELNYLKRRQNSLFIGVSFEPDTYHFSRSVGIMVEEFDGFDLFLDKHSSGYTLYVVTQAGEELLSGFDHLEEAPDRPATHREFRNKIKYNFNRLSEVFDHAWDSSVWEEIAQRCVGCGTCNLVCPTCYCFDVEDDVNLSLADGSRYRSWDGCMLNSFAKVAGGENFRADLSDRQRHRVYRKFKYITDVTGEPWCVGCGRCTAYCTAGISIVETVNRLCEEYEQTVLRKPLAKQDWVL